jgi:hypothetical protein
MRQIESRKEMSHIAQITKTKKEKERDLEKNAGAQLLTLSSEPALLGWPYTEKGTRA